MRHPVSMRAILTALCLLLLQIVALHPAGATAPLAEKPVLLRGDPPAWLTPTVREKVHEASARGLAYDKTTGEAAPHATLSFAFIRPGALMVWPSVCTVGFVYGSPGAYMLTTAGHCVAQGDRVIIASAPNLIFEIGTTTFTTQPPGGATGPDYAKISVDAQWQSSVDSDVSDVMGPQGGVDASPVDPGHPAAVKYVGWGGGGSPRAGVVDREAWDGTFYCYCAVVFGDSGAPVLSISTAFPLGQGFGLIDGFLATTNEPAWGTRLTVVGNDLVVGDGNPIPDYCPPASASPPNGMVMQVCGETGYAQLALTSSVSCSGSSADWTCTIDDTLSLWVSDLAGCANGDGLQACSTLYVPGIGGGSFRATYYVPPGGMIVVLHHILCITDGAAFTTCTSADQVIPLPGPSGSSPSGGSGPVVRVNVQAKAIHSLA